MNNFTFLEPNTIAEAAAAVRGGGAAMSGGVELLCLLKERLIQPKVVVNLKSLPGMRSMQMSNSGLHIGALVTIDALISDTRVKSDYPAISQAAEVIASPQIRNVGTIGGNLCQRPRCWYFRDPELKCLKRGGAACYAVAGNNEYHAIFGGGPCHIVHPSDLAPPFLAYDAIIVTNEREIKFDAFFVLPKQDVKVENVLRAGELVTAVKVPSDWKGAKASYYKAKERLSFDWALSSCAAVLKMRGNIIQDARIVLGGVAPIPWRSERAEAALRGKVASDAVAVQAGKAAIEQAMPMSNNAYKLPLTVNVVRIAILQAAGLPAR